MNFVSEGREKIEKRVLETDRVEIKTSREELSRKKNSGVSIFDFLKGKRPVLRIEKWNMVY